MTEDTNYNVIKAIAGANFELAMVEDIVTGEYFIAYEQAGEVTFSEGTNSYSTASTMFDAKLVELEGH